MNEQVNGVLGQQFADVAKNAGLSVSKVKLLGAYLHVDYTRESDTDALRSMLSAMKPSRIARLRGDVAGRHLDGSRDHRIVAVFGGAA